MMRIAIIGAGHAGLSAAYDLIRNGHEVVVYESGAVPGGLAGGFKKKTWTTSVESYYHHWFTSDKAMFKLIHELGWQQDLEIKQPKSVVYFKDNFYPLDSIKAIVTFPGFSLSDVIRFSLVTAYIKYIVSWKKVEPFTAHNWLKKAYGKKIYSFLWEPMLKGKFGSYYKKVTMAWMWARLKARTRQLVTFKGGFQAFSDRFAYELSKRGVTIHYKSPVMSIRSVKNKVIVTSKQTKEIFDVCLVTTSPHVFINMTKGLPETLKHTWQQSNSLGAHVLLVSLKHPLSKEKYYWYNLPKEHGFPFLALVEHTNFIHPDEINGEHLVYCGDYVEASDKRLTMSKEKLLELYAEAFKKINPDFNSDWVNEVWEFKTAYAQPVPFPNHSDNIPPIYTGIPGIYYASMSHIYPWDRGTNYAVKMGREVAAQIMNQHL